MDPLHEFVDLVDAYQKLYGIRPAYVTVNLDYHTDIVNYFTGPQLHPFVQWSGTQLYGCNIVVDPALPHRLTAGPKHFTCVPTMVTHTGFLPTTPPNGVSVHYEIDTALGYAAVPPSEPTCECGAHKVGSSNHSSWCAIK